MSTQQVGPTADRLSNPLQSTRARGFSVRKIDGAGWRSERLASDDEAAGATVGTGQVFGQASDRVRRSGLLPIQAIPAAVPVLPADEWDETYGDQRQPADGVVHSRHHREEANDDGDNVRQLENNPHFRWELSL
jgi:hypothetical protein